MILRVYRVSVPKALQKEFEKEFRAVAKTLLTDYEGLINIEIARPSEWKPLEFMMISRWENIDNIKKMAGDNWNEPHIPSHMEKYRVAHSLDHYYGIDL